MFISILLYLLAVCTVTSTFVYVLKIFASYTSFPLIVSAVLFASTTYAPSPTVIFLMLVSVEPLIILNVYTLLLSWSSFTVNVNVFSSFGNSFITVKLPLLEFVSNVIV